MGSPTLTNRDSRLRVLITNAFIADHTGSELYVRDLAVELLRRGHAPVVYSPRLGDLAHEIRAATVPVIDDLRALGAHPDIIHGQHHLQAMTALAQFPDIPAVFFCHGWSPWLETPPRHPRIRSYVAVSEAVRDRLMFEHGVPEERITTILNAVDLTRFTPRALLPAVPRQALIFSNNAAEHNYVGAVRAACARHNIALDVVGIANGNPTPKPEALLQHYDIVFARGRAALESLAVGAAVICCDIEGVGSLVTTDNVACLRRNNFGMRVLRHPITIERLSREIARYDPVDATAVSSLIRSEAGVPAAVERILEVYRAALTDWANADRDRAAEGAAMSAYLSWLSQSGGSVPEAPRGPQEPQHDERVEREAFREPIEALQVDLDRTSAERDSLRERVTRLQAVIASITGTVTWRAYRRAVGIAPVLKSYLLLSRPIKRLLAERGSKGDGHPPADQGEPPSIDPDRPAVPSGERVAGSAGDEPPQLACVVLSLANSPTLTAAVRSLRAQSVPAEIVVVNSGGGDPAETLRQAGIDVKVINLQTRLLPGAARNVGIEATRAPYVAFLAADCVAEPGWVEGRVRRHQAGSPAVSCAVTCPHPRNLWSRASYIALFSRRMPRTPEGEVLHYGVSYARPLFGQFGVFREDLRSMEDSEFNDRLAAKIPITWAPEVRSAHLHPTTPFALGRDQLARGARMARARRRLTGRGQEWRVALNAFNRVRETLRLAWQAAGPGDRAYVVGAGLLLVPAAAAYALGALSSGMGRGEEQQSRREPTILALLQFHNEMRYLPGYFRNVAPQVDGIIALDDGSTDGSGELVARQPEVRHLIRIPPRIPHVWEEPRNRRLLVDAAWRCHADWLVVVDADERLELDFRRRAQAEIARAEREGYLAHHVKFRELWDHPDRYRADGIWGQKTRVRLFKARADHEFDDRPLHGLWAPLNNRPAGDYPQADLIIYHLRMISPEDRLARQARYRRLDPDGRYQAIGYDYLTDETGLRLEAMPAGRGYEPLIAPHTLGMASTASRSA